MVLSRSQFGRPASNIWIFVSLLEARVIINDWRIDYNRNRSLSALGDLTPTRIAPVATTGSAQFRGESHVVV